MNVQPTHIAEQKSINGKAFPLVLTPDPLTETSFPDFLDWVNQHQIHIRELLVTHGAILFRDFPIDDAEAFEAVLDAAEFVNMPYIGGAAPRQQVTKGRILTANESPPDQPIPFHHEMAQVPQPPAYVFFYCEIASETGGETAIVHSNTVYRRFVEANPEFATKVEALGVKYIRVMPEQDDASSPIGRSWRSTFLAENREMAEAKMRELGTTWRWLEDGNLYTETTVVPAIRVEPRSGMNTFFNSVVAAYTGWTDCRNIPEKAVVCGDGTPVDGRAVLETSRAMDEECVAFPWQPRDLLLIDNSLVMHARRPYTGARRILASIATS